MIGIPKPTDWHRSPGRTNREAPCPICGIQSRYAGQEHRAATNKVESNRRYHVRSKSKKGWECVEVGKEWPDPMRPGYAPRQPEGERERLVKAAGRLQALGFTFVGIAKELGVKHVTLLSWRDEAKDLWEAGYESGMAEQVQAVREQAGTDAILADPNRYLRMAHAAEKWMEKRGETLFPSSGELTLDGFYRRHYLPTFLFEASKPTLSLYETILRRWRLVTGDPPLDKITMETMTGFRSFLLASRGQLPGSKMTACSVRNYLRYVHGLLSKAGPPGYRNHDAFGLIHRVPFIKPPRADRKMPTIVTDAQLEAVYNAAAMMVIPNADGVKPADWWRALIVLAYNTGMRRRNLFELRWSHVDLDARRISIPASGMKNRREQAFHLNDTAADHLRRIETARELVFCWPYDLTHFSKSFHRLQYDAGIPTQSHFGLHALRRTMATRLWSDSPEAAQLALGHAGMQVTIAHYVRSDQIVSRAIDRLPQPRAFTSATTKGHQP